jgi:hypothetical protein
VTITEFETERLIVPDSGDEKAGDEKAGDEKAGDEKDKG